MTEKPLTDAKQRLLDYLKRHDRVTTSALDAAIRGVDTHSDTSAVIH